MKSDSSISAVVVTFNRKALLQECLHALLSQTRPLDEIVVIDNASTDGTEAVIREHFPSITYVRLPENTGGAGGFHHGLSLAYEKGHEWIWVMDDDAVPALDALERLMNSSGALRDNVYALASAVLNRDGSICLGHRRLFDSMKVKETDAPVALYKQPYFEIDTASFVGLLVSRKAIAVAGLPNKDFFIYWDDTEYSLRMRRSGAILNIPDSRIVHGPLGILRTPCCQAISR